MKQREKVEKCAKSTCRSQNVQSTSAGECLEVEMLKKCRPLWRESRFQVNMLKALHALTAFEGSNSDVVLRGRCKGFCTLPNMSKR